MGLRRKISELFLRPLRDRAAERKLRAAAAAGTPLRIVLGGAAPEAGWLGSDIGFFDATDPAVWADLVGAEGRVERLLAEHVFEHIPPELVPAVLANAYRYLEPGGTIRIAVPDGHNPDPDYIRHVEPGGIGPGADDHKQLFTVESLSAALAAAGFTVEPREWFDAGGDFHEEPWIAERGHIHRCRRFGTPDKSFPSSHLSLLVDGIKA
ncbi:methyltransferase domain-containing protein [Nisaea sediminum]|uniref:methyltransferase domain-containing protein n=1 Tax=Nisaea sediminum TaxID=2775867 RepID=UPI003857C0D0